MDNKNSNKKRSNKSGIVFCIVATVCAFLLFYYMTNQLKESAKIEVTYNEFLEMVNDGKVKSVTLDSNKIVITPKEKRTNGMFAITYYTGYINDPDLVKVLKDANVENKLTYKGAVHDTGTSILDFVVVYLLPFY